MAGPLLKLPAWSAARRAWMTVHRTAGPKLMTRRELGSSETGAPAKSATATAGPTARLGARRAHSHRPKSETPASGQLPLLAIRNAQVRPTSYADFTSVVCLVRSAGQEQI